ncbi:hypothetical protein KRR40_28755 [Niabella defluvii]|nr:hypothetical protein KRR40_28755 [Niabella sp. I65]
MYVCAYADYNCTIPYVVPQDFDFEYHEENALEYWDPGVTTPTFSAASYVTTFPGGVSEFKYDDDLPIYIYTYFADIDLAEIYSINPMVRCATSNVKYVGLKTKDGGILLIIPVIILSLIYLIVIAIEELADTNSVFLYYRNRSQ